TAGRPRRLPAAVPPPDPGPRVMRGVPRPRRWQAGRSGRLCRIAGPPCPNPKATRRCAPRQASSRFDLHIGLVACGGARRAVAAPEPCDVAVWHVDPRPPSRGSAPIEEDGGGITAPTAPARTLDAPFRLPYYSNQSIAINVAAQEGPATR